MKRIVSIILSIALLVIGCSTCLAGSFEQQSQELLTTQIGQITEFKDIYKSRDGNYTLLIDGEGLAVERLNIDFSSPESVANISNNKYIPEEIRQSILEKYLTLKECNNSITAVLFVPAGTLGTRNITETTYHTENGTQMKNYRVYYSGIETGYTNIKAGAQTKTYANTVFSVALSLTSALTSSMVLGYISGGYSLYQAFVAIYGSSFATGTYNDYVQLLLRYNNYEQWTYAYIGGEWLLGLCSQKVTVTYAHLHQYYYNSNSNSGNSTDHTFNSPKTIESVHYASPWATALQWAGNPVDEWVTATINGVTFYF